MAVPVDDLAAFLCGEWRLTRHMRDRRRCAHGSAFGHAWLERRAAPVEYRESTWVHYLGFNGHAHRRHRYLIRGAGMADVLFEDGRFFHRLDLSTGRCHARHHCGDDLYLGLFRASSLERWVSRWHVSGPAKDAVIVTLYERLHSGTGRRRWLR